MDISVTKRLLRDIDLRLVLLALERMCGETPNVAGPVTGERLQELYARVSRLVPGEGERRKRMKEEAAPLLSVALEEEVKRLTDADVLDFQFEAGDLVDLCFSGSPPPVGVNPVLHAMVLEELGKQGRLVKFS